MPVEREQVAWWAGVAVGAAGVAVAARAAVPMPGAAAPLTLQTLAVLVAGVALGPVRGAAACALYLAAGAAGAPVFAGGGAGAARLLGPAGGFLLGFVPAAALAGGWAAAGRARRFVPGLVGMLLAHAVLLACGWARLAAELGAGEALARGVRPFVAGAAVKSALAAALAAVLARRRVRMTR